MRQWHKIFSDAIIRRGSLHGNPFMLSNVCILFLRQLKKKICVIPIKLCSRMTAANISSRSKRKRIFLFIHSTWDISIECLDIYRRLSRLIYTLQTAKNNKRASRNSSNSGHKQFYFGCAAAVWGACLTDTQASSPHPLLILPRKHFIYRLIDCGHGRRVSAGAEQPKV